MDITRTLPLLGGLSPQQFMSRHWQKKPLLVRGAVPGLQPLLVARELFALAAREERRVAPGRAGPAGDWRLRRGPFARRALPPLSRPGWTLLVQGVDLHDDARACAAAAVSLRARGPAGRPDDQLRQRRRRRRPALRQLRRVPAAGAGPPALAHRPPARPGAARRRAAEDPRELRARGGVRAGARRHAVPAAALCARRRRRRASARPIRSASARRRAASWRANCCSALSEDAARTGAASALYRDPAQARDGCAGRDPDRSCSISRARRWRRR